LGNVAGFGDGADVDKMSNRMGLEQRDELIEGMRGMADGEEDAGCHSPIVLRLEPARMRGFGPGGYIA
jgi:hypothetical protein